MHAERDARLAQREQARHRALATTSRDNEQRAREELEQSVYVNSIALAHWNLTHEPPNIVEAERLLDSCNPKLRGWEWDYLKRQWLDEPYVLRDSSRSRFNSIRFSPDDRYLVSAGSDGKVTVWEVATRTAVRSWVAHTNGFSFCVAFDPTDAGRLVSAGADNRVKLWEWDSTNLVQSWPIGFSFQSGMANAVAFSPDGRYIAAPVGGGKVTIWNARTGEEQVTMRREGDDWPTVFSVAFSPDGKLLAAGVGGLVYIWDARSGKHPTILGRPTNPVAGLVFSKDGQRLAAASFDSSVRIWDVSSREMLWRWRAHNGQSYALALSPDNQRLVTGGADRTVKLWAMDWVGRTNHEVLTFRDFRREVQCAAFSHDGQRLAACSVDGTIQLWNSAPRPAADNETLLSLDNGGEVRTMNFHQGRSWIAAGGDRLPDTQGGKAPVFIWNARTGGLVQKLSREGLYLFSATFSPNGRFLAATADDREYQGGYNLQVWDLESNRPSASIQTFPGEGCVFSQCYSPDGRHLVGGTQDGRILVWDGLTGQTNGVLGQHNGAVFALVFSPDGRHLASSSHTEQVKLWDATQLGLLQTNPVELATTAVGEISGTLAFSHNSQRLVVATDDQLATVWDAHRGTMLLPVRSDSVHGFRAVAFSPDGRWIASGGTDCRVKVWDAETGVLLHTFRGHKGEVLRVGFLQTPDGLRLISGSRDGTIKFWDLGAVQDRDPRR